MRCHKTSIFLLLPPSSTLQALKEEIARALNDAADSPRNVRAEDITVYKQSGGNWKELDEGAKNSKTKRSWEATLQDLDVKGVGSGSTLEHDNETLAYTVKNGLKEEQELEVEPFPRDD